VLEIYERLGRAQNHDIDDVVVLSHEQRERGRIKAESNAGTEVRIFLERGSPLLVGEMLKSQCGKYVRVDGAVENSTKAFCDDWQRFSRACYHLGNRHVKVELGDRWLRILPDHVLEDMLVGLGLTVEKEVAVFNPESGAYQHAH